MGSFVAISPSPHPESSERIFRLALHAGEVNAGRSAASVIRSRWSGAAVFPRENGSGFEIATDSLTSSWLGVIGTCVAESGGHRPEDLLRLYLAGGSDKLSRALEGFFTIFIGDGRTQELTVITDVIGSCHSYIREIAGSVVLSSSSLLLASLGDVTLDSVGCQEFLGTGIIFEDRTLYHDVKKLPAASIITFHAGSEVARRVYWDVSSLSADSVPTEEAADNLWSTLVSAASKVGSRFDRIACDLTGGYDSRVMVAAFVGANQKFATVVSGEEDEPDVVVSRGLASKLGLQHRRFARPGSLSLADLENALQITDGEYDVVEYSAIARIHRQLSQEFQVSINGSFGEVARGYWWELLVPHTGSTRKLDSLNLALRRYAWSSCDDLFQPQYRLNLAGHIASVIERATSDLSGYPNTFQMDVTYLRMRMHRWQGRIASSTNKLWPCLSPFMSRSVLESMLQSPSGLRQRSLLVRKMLARYQPAIAEYPLEHGWPAAPATAHNLPQFWPIVPYYQGRILAKLGFYWKSPSRQPDSPLVALRNTAETRSVLDCKSMKSISVLEPSAIAAFLEASREPYFTRAKEWNRLLTLEMALTAASAFSSQVSTASV